MKKLIPFLTFFLILTSCKSDLSIFINKTLFHTEFDGVRSVVVNEDGHFELSWNSATSKNRSVEYEIYVTESKAALSLLNAADSDSDKLLSTTEVSGRDDEVALLADQAIFEGSTKDTKFVLDERIIDPETYYVFEVRVKGRNLTKKLSKSLLSKVNFSDISSTSLATTRDSLNVSWPPIAGATSYEIFENSENASPILSTKENHLALSFFDAARGQDFCLRAVRGTLKSKTCIPIAGIGKHWTPKIISAQHATAAGVYTTGQSIQFDIKFSDLVQVTEASELFLPFSVEDQTQRRARYLSGAGSDTLSFIYEIKEGDNSQGIPIGSKLLEQSPNLIRDTQGRTADLSFVLLDKTFGSDLSIDTSPPNSAQSIGFASTTQSSASVTLHWAGGEDNNFDHFIAMLCESDDCSDACSSPLQSAGNSLIFPAVDGKTYFGCVQTIDKVGLRSSLSSSLQSISIDMTPPSILQVSSPLANGYFKEGTSIPIEVQFTEPVFVQNATDIALSLQIGTQIRSLSLISGSGSDTLSFNYVVAAGDNTPLLTTAPSGLLRVGASGSISDRGGNTANLTLPISSSLQSLGGAKIFVIDTIAPTSPGSVTFGASTSISTNLNFSWTAAVDANLKEYRSKICANTGCNMGCSADYVTTASTATLLGANGQSYYACVRSEDKAGQVSAWVTSSVILVDSQAPSVVSVTTSKVDGVYKEGVALSIRVTFSENVVLSTSSPTLALNFGGRFASYQSGGGSTTLTFSYTTQVGDNSSSLNYLSTGSLVLNGSTLKDEAGNNADLTLPNTTSDESLGGLSNIRIDTTSPIAPSSVNVSSSSSNPTTYGLSWAISTDANFLQHNVKLCTGSNCSSGCLTEASSVGSPMTLIGVGSVTYFGCVQGEDQVGHKTAWIASGGSVVVDNTAPSILNVTSNVTSGFYPETAIIPILVHFSEPVFLSSTNNISLSLGSGITAPYLSLSSGNGTDTLVFNYTVALGDSSADLDTSGSTALTLSGGATLQDSSGNNAVLTLPNPGAPQSLGALLNLVIDTVPPSAPLSLSFTSATNNNSSPGLTWTNGSDTNFLNHEAKLCSANDCSATCLLAGSFVSSPGTLSSIADGHYYACLRSKDKAGHVSSWLASSNAVNVDATLPTITQISSSSPNGTYKAGTVLTLHVTFSEPITVSGVPTLTLETGVTDRVVNLSSSTGSTLTFLYTVQAGDVSSRLEALSLSAAGSITDGVGNAAIRTLPSSGSPNSLSVLKSLVIDTSAPQPAFTSPAASFIAAGSIVAVIACETGTSLSISGDLINTVNALCTSGSLTRTLYFSTPQGAKSVLVQETDTAGNIGSVSRSFINDTTPPNLTQTTALPTTYSSATSLVLGGSCENYSDVVILFEDAEDGRVSCSSSTWTYSTSTVSTDATRVYTINQSDSAGNKSQVLTTWVRDSQSPGFLFEDFTSTFTVTVTANSYTFKGSCDSSPSTQNPSILVAGPGITGTESTNCVLGSWSYLSPTQSSNGFYLYTFTQSDRAGNGSTIYGSWTRDVSGPAFTISNNLLKSKDDTVTFNGTCSAAFSIAVTGPGSPTSPACTSGLWSFPTPVSATDGSLIYNLSQTNGLGTSTTVKATFIRDTTAPVVSGLKINNNASATLAYRVSLALAAVDAGTAVQSLCFFQAAWPDSSTSPTPPAPPTASDNCWQSLSTLGVAGGKSISATDISFTLSLASAKYSVYAFAKDELGNISTTSNSDGAARATITLNLPLPPAIAILDVTDSSEDSQVEFTAGDEIDLHWKLTGGSGIGANPVGIRWSSDDNSWTSIVSALPNSASGCSLVAGATGCYRFTVPSSQYFRLQLSVSNSAGNLYFRESKPINTGGRVRTVVGRTFKGLDGTARGYQLNYGGMDSLRTFGGYNFVVTRQGVIYVIDTSLGILRIDPKDQIVRLAYKKSAYPGDGAIGANLSFNGTNGLWLDKSKPLQRLFVSDGSVLRIIDFNKGTTKSIAGTDSSGINGTGATREVFMGNDAVFTRTLANFPGITQSLPAVINETTKKFEFFRYDPSALPLYSSKPNTYCEDMKDRSYPLFNANGSLVMWASLVRFFSSTETAYNCRGQHVWQFNYPGSMTGTYLGEEGASGLPAMLPTGFNQAIDVSTQLGLNGKVYAMIRLTAPSGGIVEYSQAANTWTKVLGLADPAATGYQKSCVDGTAADQCDVDLNSGFVDEAGTLYFMDQGQIRLVDANKKVQTIFGTSIRTLEDGLNASDSVLGSDLAYFQRRIDSSNKEEVVFSHYPTFSYRRVIDGEMSILAGNGINWPGLNSGAASGPAPGVKEGWTLQVNNPFAMDEDGNIYAGDYGADASGMHSTIFKLTRSLALWSTLIPYTCAGCIGLAYDQFNPAHVSYAPTTSVQLYSARLGIPTPNTQGLPREMIKPAVLGFQNGKIYLHTQEVPFVFKGTTNATFTNNYSYPLDVSISAADPSTFNGSTVKGLSRLVGRKGAVLEAAASITSLTPSNSLGFYNSLPTDGVAADLFGVKSTPWNGPDKTHTIRSFQSYEGAYYFAQSSFSKNLLRINSGNLVNTAVTTALDIAAFTLKREGSDTVLYYCATSGALRKRNLTTATNPVESAISLSIPGATCAGATLLNYENAGQDYLMFVYKQNSMNGIMELKISP
ncbi:MAG: hypothetical protein EOP10_02290 [Proteobacteria bacterium]|nr:MAG: hypothetical protein EOP10_02290 [Pseudomonadota bacterium]